MAQHSTEAARGPIESSVQDRGRAPCAGMRAAVGLKPARLQNADGIRTEPPVSVTMAATAVPSATDTPAHDEDPPGLRPVARSQGLLALPACGLRPAPETANSRMCGGTTHKP